MAFGKKFHKARNAAVRWMLLLTSDSSWLQPMKPKAASGSPDSAKGDTSSSAAFIDCCQMKLSSTTNKHARVLVLTSTT